MTFNAPAQVLEAHGQACITLTPLIKKTIVELEPGQVLEVHTDDPAAREGIPAWCRLTRNSLLETIEHDPTTTTFHIRAKEQS